MMHMALRTIMKCYIRAFIAMVFLLSLSAACRGADERYFVRQVVFPDGVKALTVTPESWTFDGQSYQLVSTDGKKLALSREKAGGFTACQWAELTGKFVDFPSDANVDVDQHKRDADWYSPRGADDACLAFIISGRSTAMVVRSVFRANGNIYSIASQRLFWGKDIDAPAFVALEKNVNLISNYLYFKGVPGYDNLEQALNGGGLMVSVAQGGDGTQTIVKSLPALSQTAAGAGADGGYSGQGMKGDADLLRAEDLKLNGKYADAELIYRALLPKIPFEAQIGLGDICADTGRLDEGIEHFQAAATISPNSAEPYNGLGKVYFAKQAWDTAREYFNRALQADGKNTVALSNLGWSSIASQDMKAALGYFKQAVQLGPEPGAVVGVYSGLGAIALASGQPDDALAYADVILKQLPDNPIAYSMRARAFLDKNDPVSALEAATRAVELAPAQHQFHAFAAMAAFKLKKYDDAEQQYQLAIENTPRGDNAAAQYYASLATVYAAAGDKKKAADTANAGLKLFPGDKEITDAMGEINK